MCTSGRLCGLCIPSIGSTTLSDIHMQFLRCRRLVISIWNFLLVMGKIIFFIVLLFTSPNNLQSLMR